MLTYAIAHMFQLFSYCYVGHELSIQSGNMATAIYNCNWENSDDTELKKAIVLMIQRSQKQQIFTAADITNLDLVSYVTVLRLSFSFYTLFNNLIDRRNAI
ncbi:7tm Odorant receptor [Popillia japonica]|uniref:7tm Odorant receptor n=1 Tax=Popillia japonica TaxID=7064 RepID=A0AAW1K2F6_POPJA